MAYVHPSLRTKLFPTQVADISKALADAQEPDPNKRDARPLMALLTALPKAHPGVLADMQTRTNKALGYEWTIAAQVPYGETSPPEVEAERAAAIMRRFTASGLHTHLRTLWASRYYGVVALETMWGLNEFRENAVIGLTPIEPVELKQWPTAGRGWARLVYPSYDSDRYTLAPYDLPQQAIIATYNPFMGVDNDYVGGLLASILWYSFLQYVNWWHWSRMGERVGVLQYTQGTDPAAIANAYSFLQNVAEHAVQLPETLKLMIKELLGDPPSGESYAKFIETIDGLRQRLILGQDVVQTSQDAGSWAKSKEAAKITGDHMWSDITDIQTVISDQYVRVDYELNYGVPTSGLYPQFRFLTDEAEDYKANASVISQMSSAGFEPEDMDEVSRKVGYKVVKSESQPINLNVT